MFGKQDDGESDPAYCAWEKMNSGNVGVNGFYE